MFDRGPGGGTAQLSLLTNMTVIRLNLIYDSISLGLSTQSPFECPSMPTRKELEENVGL